MPVNPAMKIIIRVHCLLNAKIAIMRINSNRLRNLITAKLNSLLPVLTLRVDCIKCHVMEERNGKKFQKFKDARSVHASHATKIFITGNWVKTVTPATNLNHGISLRIQKSLITLKQNTLCLENMFI